MCISLGDIIKLILNQAKTKSFLESKNFDVSRCIEIIDTVPEMRTEINTFNDFENHYDYILCSLHPFITIEEFNLLKKHRVVILGVVMELFECITD
jgi:hypothetical protein